MKRMPARQLPDAARPRLNPKLTAIAKEMEALELDERASRLRSKWGNRRQLTAARIKDELGVIFMKKPTRLLLTEPARAHRFHANINSQMLFAKQGHGRRTARGRNICKPVPPCLCGVRDPGALEQVHA
jgi:hypothetical protein